MDDRFIGYLLKGDIRLVRPDRLRAVRVLHNKSQTELGNALGVSHQTIAQWELGKAWPSNENAQKLMKLLGVDGPRVFVKLMEMAEDELDDTEETAS